MLRDLWKRLSAAALMCCSLFVLHSVNAQTVTVNGTTCSGNWSISGSPTNTVITLPSSCLGPPPACTGAPTITGVSPTSGPVGQTVNITGTNLCSGSTVSINGVAATGVSGGGASLAATVAAGTSGTGAVVVTTPNGSVTSTQTFTVNANPGITSITPAGTAPGGAVTITGSNFAAGATVTFNGTAAVVSAVTATTITTTIPSTLAAGSTVSVIVTVGNVASAPLQYTLGGGAGGGAGYFSIEGKAIPEPSKDYPGQPAPARPGEQNGAGPYMNAYAIDLTRLTGQKCGTATPPVSRLWWHNIDFAKYQSSGAPELPLLAGGEALTWKFTAPASGTNFFTYDSGGDGNRSPAFMTLSDTPCDFDTAKVTGPTAACYKSGATVGLYWTANAGAGGSWECKIEPGRTYFVNLRMQDARPTSQGGSPTVDACAARGFCGGSVQIR
jgi:IPT/TIG domain